MKIIFNYSEALLQVPPEVTVHTSSPAVDLLYALYFYLTVTCATAVAFDLDAAREAFEASTDFTVGLEEEFAILDPATLDARRRASRSCATPRGATRCSPSRSPAS